MGLYSPHVEERTFYRGQVSDYGVVLSAGWRKHWRSRQALTQKLPLLAEDYLAGTLDRAHLEDELIALAALAKDDDPTLQRFLREPAGRQLVTDILTHIRDSVGPAWRAGVAHAQLAELESAFLLRYQAYVFNEASEAFLARVLPNTLRRMGDLLLRFYDVNRGSFDVESRISQVAIDFMGVLQHYGVVGTPGLDVTSDLAVALWFATHRYNPDQDRYSELLPPTEWGWVYTAHLPVVIWSQMKNGAADRPPEMFAVNLADLSPLLTRPARQQGWYVIHGLGWERIIDYWQALRMTRRRAIAYGAANVTAMLAARGLSELFLFPSSSGDPFRSHLEAHGVTTFL